MVDVLEIYIPFIATGQLVLDTYHTGKVLPLEIVSLVIALINYYMPSQQISEYFFKTEDVVEFARYSENVQHFNRNYVTKNPMQNDVEIEKDKNYDHIRDKYAYKK